jgi:GTPase SAR1 family protein
MENYNSLKILVVGDPSVGKTSLINILCQNEVKKSTSWTIGCHLDIKLYNYEKTNRNYYLEFIETNNRCKHPKSREMFYKDIKGIILVHDLSNNKSYKNLWKWLKEIIHSETFKSSDSYNGIKSSNNDLDLKIEVESPDIKLSVPLLVVGNKADLVTEQYRINKSDIANTFNGTSVCMTSTSLDVSSISYATNYNVFYNFYNQVIEHSDTMAYNVSKQYPIASSAVTDLHLSVPNNKWRSKYNLNLVTGSGSNLGISYGMQPSPVLSNPSVSPQLHSLSPQINSSSFNGINNVYDKKSNILYNSLDLNKKKSNNSIHI